MRVLICGSRGWDDPKPIDLVIAGYVALTEARDEELVIIHGDAPGADRLAGQLAARWRVDVIAEPADWNQHGRAAGPIRNQKMIDEHQPDVIWGFRSVGKSAGTDDMLRRGYDAGIPTYTIEGSYQ